MEPELLSTKLQHLMIQYHERNPGWGSLHIVMDDGNLEDEHVKWCLNYALENYDGDGAIIAYKLSQMTQEYRSHLYNIL